MKKQTQTKRHTIARSLCLGLVALTTAWQAPAALAAATPKQPNILLIMADDLGYSDIGRFGGEIATPNLDRLAHEGVTMTRFHASPFCSPTRAMLMSGSDNHLVGLGDMAELITKEQRGHPGYEGVLNDRVVTVAQVLKDAGYRTAMVGKWHLGIPEQFSPAARGFDQSYAMVQGGASHYDDQSGIVALDPNKPPRAIYREDGKLVDVPKGFYSTDFYTSKMLDYLKSGESSGKPFFAYMAYTAPHWPLQAHEVDIAKYEGRYKEGYEALRTERLARMKQLGIVPDNTDVFIRSDVWPAWDTLSPAEKASEAKRMAVYAAMVDSMDQNIGKVLDYLKQTGQLDNTFIFFLSDNGADGNSIYDLGRTREWVHKDFDNSIENLGKKGSFAEYGPGWAQVGSTPNRLYKSYLYQGGIAVPAIAWGPGIKAGTVKDAFAYVQDIAPTLYAVAGTRHPGTRYKGKDVLPVRGKSMLPYLNGKAEGVHGADDAIGWELGGRKALRKGDWKIVFANKPWGTNDWELFNLAEDPAELHDLSKKNPQKLGEMLVAWQDYVRETGVLEIPHLAERPGYSNAPHYYEDLEYEAGLKPRSPK